MIASSALAYAGVGWPLWLTGRTATARREPTWATSSTLRTTVNVRVSVLPPWSVATTVIVFAPSTSGTP